MKYVSKSWGMLKPLRQNLILENFDDYLDRMYSLEVFNHIPKEVFHQWIHPLHEDEYTLRNYAWMNYERISFEIKEWTFEELLKLSIIPDFEAVLTELDYPLEDVVADDADLAVWLNHGTWRIPPIVLDVSKISNIPPKRSTIKGPYQLVEGHTRLRNLHIAKLRGNIISIKHKIYLMYPD